MSKRQDAWRFVCCCFKAGDSFSVEQIAAATEMHTENAKAFIRKLVQHGRVERTWQGRCSLTHRYRLLDDKPLPHQQTRKQLRPNARQRAWNSCRMLRTFRPEEITATSGVASSTVRRYLRALERARILRRIHDTEVGELLRLNLDLGAKPPEPRLDGVYAPSRDRFYPYKEEA
ncbi:hypothetical protein PVT67_11805 [Gallaecimonas kandeliae]|uniref:hypothetical protein n=1 Tax=Gallaecimonas kandeliae TaxID=3029055 RepID=UPI002649EC03|nr:hypothetical protein [Gallaecimonas kandeliae]WKE64363.1 hypothetical protein PVT67_11805 [Gallaecimonas kandeliae]